MVKVLALQHTLWVQLSLPGFHTENMTLDVGTPVGNIMVVTHLLPPPTIYPFLLLLFPFHSFLFVKLKTCSPTTHMHTHLDPRSKESWVIYFPLTLLPGPPLRGTNATLVQSPFSLHPLALYALS